MALSGSSIVAFPTFALALSYLTIYLHLHR